MKIAVLSDIHENFHNLIVTLEECKKLGVEQILFLWDFMNNGIAKIMAASLIPIFAIRWNNDGDKVAITKTALAPDSNLKIWFETFDVFEVDNKRLFLTHYPMLAKPMAKSWDFAAVFYGHDHKHNIDKIDDCLIVNPWEVSAHKFGKCSFALYDTTKNTAEIVFLENILSLHSEKMDTHLDTIWMKLSSGKTHQY